MHKSISDRSKKNPLKLHYFLILFSLLAGVLFSCWMVWRADNLLREELLAKARLISQTLKSGEVGQLTGTEPDLDTRIYQDLTGRLSAIKNSRKDYRYVYLMGKKDDQVIFLIDAPDDIDSSSVTEPGEIYKDASPELKSIFSNGEAIVEGPLPDEWGVWVSALVPIVDSNGKVSAVFGIDVDARDWKWLIAERVAIPLGLTVVILICFITLVFALRDYSASPKPVLRRLIVPVFSVLIIMVAAFVFFMTFLQSRHLDKLSMISLRETQSDFNHAIAQQTKSIEAIQKVLLENSELPTALKAKDRKILLTEYQPIFEQLNKDMAITHLYFMDAERNCLLRVHYPGKYGDRIDRLTARQAELTGKVSSGLELGPLGTFTLRVVMPVFEGKQLLGYIELGKEVEDVIDNISRANGVETALVIRKDLLDQTEWENGMAMLGRKSDWGLFEYDVLVYSSLKKLPSNIDSFIGAGRHIHGQTSTQIEFNNSIWRLMVYPLKDASGAEVGDMVVLNDITQQASSYKRFITLSIVFGITLIGAILGFLFILLRKTDIGILSQQSELRESEKRFKMLASQNRTIVWEVDPQGLFTYISDVAHEVLGYAPEELIGKVHFYDLHPMSGRSEFRAESFDVFHKREEFVGMVNPVETKSGEILYFSTSGIPILGDNGELLGYRGSDLDITRRVKVQQELELNQTRLQKLVNILQHPSTSIQEFLDYALQQAIELTGSKIGYIYHYDEQKREFILNTWSKEVMAECSVINPKTCYELDKTGIWGEAVRQRKPIVINDFEASNPHKKGLPKGHVRLSKFMTVPVFQGDSIVGVVGLANKPQDYDDADVWQTTLLMEGVWKVIELKRVQEELLASESRYRSYVENAPLAVFTVDPNGKYLEVNPATAKMTGYSESELLSMNSLDVVSEKSLEKGQMHLQHVADEGYSQGELSFETREGDQRFCHIDAVDLGDNKFLVFCRDITELRKAQRDYRLLFDGMLEGFGLHKIILDSNGQPVDYEFIAVNPAFEKMTGLKAEDVIGRRVLEVLPQTEKYWIDSYGRVALTGEPLHFENYSAELDRYFEVSVFSPAVEQFACVITDVTQRRQSEERLKLLNQRFELAVNSAKMGILELDIKTGDLVWNSRMFEIYGLSSDEVKLTHENWLESVHPDDRDSVISNFKIAIDSKVQDSVDFRVIRPSGEVRHIKSHVIIVRSDSSEPLKMIGVNFDITEQKQVEDRLNFQALVLDQIQDIVTVTDMEGNIQYVNLASIRKLRLSRDEIVGRNISTYGENPAKGATQSEILETTKQKGQWRGEVVNYDAQGREIIMDCRTSIVMNHHKEPVALCGISTDITQQKLNAQIILEKERRLELALEGGDLGAWDWNVINGEVLFNLRWAEMLGYSIEELEPHLSTFNRLVHPEDLPGVNKKLAEVLSGKTQTYEAEFRMLHKNGKYIWILDKGKIFERDENGKPVRMCGTHLDITDIKEAEIKMLNIRQKELEIGIEIQNELLFGKVPKNLNCVEISALSIPSAEIDGDFYDFIKYDDNHFDLFLGDVMGKGISASLFGAATKTQFLRTIYDLMCSNTLATLPTLEEIVSYANENLSNKLISLQSFVTACIARFNMEKKRMDIIDCGHPYILHYSKETGKCERIKGNNYPIGFSENETYEQKSVHFKTGDIFCFYSDGIIEVQNDRHEFFGMNRLEEFICSNSQVDAHTMGDLLIRQLKAFDGEVFNDDITLIFIKITDPPESKLKHSFRCEFEGNVESVNNIRCFVNEKLSGLIDVDPKFILMLELAISEAVANIIKHAYKNIKKGPVAAKLDVYADRVEITLSHSGQQMKKRQLATPSFDGSQDGGYGLYLIRNTVDKIELGTDANGLINLKLIKYLG